MVSGVEIPGLILFAPQAIESVVKIIRVAKEWYGVDEEFKSALERGKNTAADLRMSTDVILTYCLTLSTDVVDNLDPQALLLERLQNAIHRCKKTNDLIKLWNGRLYSQLPRCQFVHSEVSNVGTGSTNLVSEQTDIADRLIDKELKNAVGEIIYHKGHRVSLYARLPNIHAPSGPVVTAASGSGSPSRPRGTRAACISVARMLKEGSVYFAFKSYFLMIGAREIKNAIERMEASSNDVKSAIELIKKLSETPFWGNNAIAFINEANGRRESRAPVAFIESQYIVQRAPLHAERKSQFHIVSDGPYKGCIIELRAINAGSQNTAIQDTEAIARLLAEDTQKAPLSGVGILRCCGYSVSKPDKPWLPPKHHELVFRMVPGSEAETLRSILCSDLISSCSLDDRLRFSLDLAIAIHILHSIGLVHQGIRPASILVMRSCSSSSRSHGIGTPYLAGFNYTRSENTISGMRRLRDEVMAEDLYQHPVHLPERKRAYQTQDDIYSLGVCLLEIGLGESFFRWDSTMNAYIIASKWDFFNIADALPDGSFNDRIFYQRKDALIELAKARLPSAMGHVYADVVVECLEFVEVAKAPAYKNTYSGCSRFIENVILELHRSIIPRRRRL